MSNSISSSDEEEEVRPRARRRYKQHLFPGYNPTDVCSQTRRRWDTDFFSTEPSAEKEVQHYTSPTSPTYSTEESSVQDLGSTTSVEMEDQNEDQNKNPVNNHIEQGVSFNVSISNEPNIVVASEDEAQSCTDTESSEDLDERVEDGQSTEEESESSESETNSDHDRNTDFDALMFQSSELTVRDVVIMINAFALRHYLTDEAKLDMAHLIKICAGPEAAEVSLSLYKMEKCFSSQKDKMTYHYYCKSCYEKVFFSIKASKGMKSTASTCPNCRIKDTVSLSSKNYLIGVDLKYQLEQLLNNDKILHDVIKNYVRREEESEEQSAGKFRDVHDGLTYKKMMAAENEEDSYLFTINISTDGAPANKKKAFWPLQVTVNELSPKLRFRYLLLSGIMIAEKEPNPSLMKLFINKTLVEQVKNLYITIKRQETSMKFKICVSNVVADSVARPVIQNRISYSGYYGCSWCYIHGTYLDKCGVHYLMKEEMPLRTNTSHNADIRVVELKKSLGIVDIDSNGRKKKGTTERGVKGSSGLHELLNIDMVWSFPYEKLHGLLFGPAYQLWTEWQSPDCKYKMEPKVIKDIEKRFLSITPSQEVHRLPRAGVVLGKSKPKASELDSWTTLYSLPCLEGILDSAAFKHYTLLVKSTFILSKLEITEEELTEVDECLKKFVAGYEELYGAHRMTFNVHALLHAAQSVRESGPLIVNSAFPFEHQIYYLKQFIKGPTGMDKQMAKKHLQKFMFTSGNVRSLQVGDSVIDFCEYLYGPKRLRKQFSVCENVTFCGPSKLKIIDNVNYLSYKKCVIADETKFHSVDYKLAKQTDDTIVKLESEKYARIVSILKKNDDTCHLLLSEFELYPNDPFPPVTHIKKVKSENEDERYYFIEPLSKVICKVNLMNVRNARFVGIKPNTIEIQ